MEMANPENDLSIIKGKQFDPDPWTTLENVGKNLGHVKRRVMNSRTEEILLW